MREQRDRTGTPHWIVIDEAHEPFSDNNVSLPINKGEKGYCLITYKPSDVRADVTTAFDFVLAVSSKRQAKEVIEMVSSFTHYPRDGLERFLQRGSQRGASLLIRVPSMDMCALTIAPRALKHVRHLHKYVSNSLPYHQYFVFRSEEGLTGGRAGNIPDFHNQLQRLDHNSLLHHLKCGDFSRWIGSALQDVQLAKTISDIEGKINTSDPSGNPERLRREILTTIYQRYLK